MRSFSRHVLKLATLFSFWSPFTSNTCFIVSLLYFSKTQLTRSSIFINSSSTFRTWIARVVLPGARRPLTLRAHHPPLSPIFPPSTTWALTILHPLYHAWCNPPLLLMSLVSARAPMLRSWFGLVYTYTSDLSYVATTMNQPIRLCALSFCGTNNSILLASDSTGHSFKWLPLHIGLSTTCVYPCFLNILSCAIFVTPATRMCSW